MELILLDECHSTNSYAASLEMPPDDDMRVISARAQTAGRGQRGNSWEAEPGKNLTFSVVWRQQGVGPAAQFSISEAVALAVCDLLRNHDIESRVKWPNDIYVGERKICGILIEHSLWGAEIRRTIAGVGINVNQRIFHSDAPNPVSMTQLTGLQYDLNELLKEYVALLSERLTLIASPAGKKNIHKEYCHRMWRFDGVYHTFRDVASGESYQGKIKNVEPSGYLYVEEKGSEKLHRYAFKEVEFLIFRD